MFFENKASGHEQKSCVSMVQVNIYQFLKAASALEIIIFIIKQNDTKGKQQKVIQC